jgi:hypothetical protein
MARFVTIEFPLPEGMEEFRLPPGVDFRLQQLLDRQDQGTRLSEAERREAEGLVALAEWLSLLRLKAERTRLAEA